MSAATKPEPGTEIQLASSVAVGALPPQFQQALEMRKLQNQVAGQLASLNWGKQLDLPTRRAIADWGQQFRVDTTTEIHVLGGNVYLNALFYLRLLSEMIAAGLVEYAYADHVEEDPRLVKLGPEGEGEMSRRLRERIMHQIPDKAASAVVFRVKLRSMAKEVVGVKWCGNGTRKNDPVGDSVPVETSESRAARRCMRLLSSHVPPQKAEELERVEHSAEILSERIAHARNEIRASEARIAALPPGRSAMPAMQAPLSDPADPYSPIDESRVPLRGADDPRTSVESRVAPPRSDASRAVAEHVASTTKDPYDADDAPSRPRSSGSSFPLPFTQGAAKAGTPLRDVSDKDLSDAVRFADGVVKYESFVEVAAIELEERRLAAEDAMEGEGE